MKNINTRRSKEMRKRQIWRKSQMKIVHIKYKNHLPILDRKHPYCTNLGGQIDIYCEICYSSCFHIFICLWVVCSRTGRDFICVFFFIILCHLFICISFKAVYSLYCNCFEAFTTQFNIFTCIWSNDYGIRFFFI